MRHAIYSLLLLFAFMQAIGVQTAAAADRLEELSTSAANAYQQKDYPRSVALYKECLKHNTRNASLYYNLGNSYFRLQDYPQAVLNYERALRLTPGDKDIRFNLDLTKTKLEDQFGERSEMFFVRWLRQWMDCQNADGWAAWGISLFVLSVVLFFIYRFVHLVFLRKICFFSSLAVFALMIVANVFAYLQHSQVEVSGRAVVMRVCALNTEPSSTAKKNFDLHPGTAVDILDSTIQGWTQVALSDGRVGWVENSKIEIV